MRYNQDSNNTSLTLESQHPPPVIFPAPLLSTGTAYTTETTPFYTSSFPGLDVRQRLGSSNNNSSTGMAHSHRNATLPTPYSTRSIYSPPTPLFNRPDHSQRPAQYPGPARRPPLSPTPSPNIGFPNSINSIRMDPNQYAGGKGQANVPPLQSLTMDGQLFYVSPHTNVKIDIHGIIDKGFFLSDGDWTCYRRNYFSCVCSYSFSPNYPGMAMQYTPNSSTESYDVYGFAMTISAVVADSDSHTIELVQHTPKRDKGPTTRPEKVQLNPKLLPQNSHPLGGMYGDSHNRITAGSSSGALYGDYPPHQGSHPTEHTFERIQFKQATANNGKRRAAQQYYHLVIELHANLSEPGRAVSDNWTRIARRKSAKMIVRGRSPGHYQSERRGSASSGPGGGTGTLGSFSSSQVSDYTNGPPLLGTAYSTGGYDSRAPHHYGTSRQHDLSTEPPLMSAEEVKTIENTKEYQYYPTPIYEGTDPRQGIEMFLHRTDQDSLMTPLPGAAEDSAMRMKQEQEGSRLYFPGTQYIPRNCKRFEGKSSSVGFYPTVLQQPSS
ncbi:hypothetical protein BX600DRAFT_19363 [Xylariales sp. PMI_506]|nr:hypothetical protein BX600DRAFT_19363 [Xylariales sp. PMI_506]